MDRTLAIVKPDAFEKGYMGDIISMILADGFYISNIKIIKMTKRQAAKFYEVHKDRPFYEDLQTYMSSGHIVPMVLYRPDAVNEFRRLIGATDPLLAAEGTIRKRFATNKSYNAIHGSDSVENAEKEAHFFFKESEIVANLHS